MRVSQAIWKDGAWNRTGEVLSRVDLVLAFGARQALDGGGIAGELRRRHPDALLFGCSTAGEIASTEVLDDTVVATEIEFSSTQVRGAVVHLRDMADARTAGCALARMLPHDGLAHVLVLSDGTEVNGTELVRGLVSELPAQVLVTGGLSADGANFESTAVCFGDVVERGVIGAVGFYGDRIHVGSGSLGGWDPFGPERIVTKARANVLLELDGRPALELYREYLGPHSQGLPASGLLFPLSIRVPDAPGIPLVRTLLGIDESTGSMTFAGDIPAGSRARLMKANFERLIDGAIGAARASHDAIGGHETDFALLISCVGRKLVLKQRVEEEIEGVRDVLGERPVLAGFYSYGEICPAAPSAGCELHNQTMTITTFRED